MKKSVISVLAATAGATVGAVLMGKKEGKKTQKEKDVANKHLALFLMMNQWVKVKQQGKSIATYFEKEGYKNIAVYGMSYAGETLLDELKNTDIHVAYGIDKNADMIYADINVVTMDDILDDVDAVVVTAVTFFNEIEEALSEKMNCPVISLEDILYEV